MLTAAVLAADRPRSGRPRVITPEREAAIITATLLEAPPDAGPHWSTRLTAQRVIFRELTTRPLRRLAGGAGGRDRPVYGQAPEERFQTAESLVETCLVRPKHGRALRERQKEVHKEPFHILLSLLSTHLRSP